MVDSRLEELRSVGAYPLAFATLFTRFKNAGMPRLVFRMDRTQPLPAYSAMMSGCSVAWIVRGRETLTNPFQIAGFRLILLLQHNPSGPAHSMRVTSRGDNEKQMNDEGNEVPQED